MISSLENLKEIRKKNKNSFKDTILVGMNSCGIAAGAEKVYNLLKKEIEAGDLDINLKKSGCLGACYAEPLVEVSFKDTPGVVYRDVTEDIAKKIISTHYHNKEIIEDSIYSLAGDFPDKISSSGKKFIFIKNTDIDKSRDNDNCLELLRYEIIKNNAADKIQAAEPEILGIYNKGIAVTIWPDNITYAGVKKEEIPGIVKKTVLNKVADKLLFEEKNVKYPKIVLRNCGRINPEDIEDYIAVGGYSGLEKVISEYNSEKIIQELRISGLRGRGGAGFPTWQKWKFARSTENSTKYIICNADEGDPGAYMDRSVLEGDPHSILEGMLIASIAIGATKGFIYIRAEYPLAIKRACRAIDQARDYNVLGKKILGTDFSFDIEVRLGAGAFVCGEETALIASIEGKRGTPVPRPPYPSVKGLWGKPTVINNVETLANIPEIIRKGGNWFSKIGTEKSKGTKVFALTGKVKNSGLVEVPMGTTLKEIVFNLGGGGLYSDVKIKAVQTGGPSGGVIPADYLDTPVEYESLTELGSIMGSGGMIVMDENDCMVDMAKFYLRFCVDESCGKCIPCRIGGYQLLDILSRITHGEGKEEDLEKIKKIAHTLSKASLCGLGQTAANPVNSTLHYFKDEYFEHINNHKCPARKCRELLNYTIDRNLCRKCGLCARTCPADAIIGNGEEGYKIITEKCTRCGECYEICKFKAVIKK